MDITVNSYFSGAGLFDTGLALGGLTLNQSFEIDEAACNVFEHNLPHDVQRVDISQKLVMGDDDADMMVVTYPCNKYSTIGDIHGVRTGDDLYLHAFRHMALKQPEMYVLENVPGMKKFPLVMEAMTQLPDYYVHVYCPIKAETWLPQRRDRLMIIGTKKPFSFRPPEAHSRVSLADIIEKDPEVTWPDSIRKRMNGEWRDLPIISDPERGDIAPTCVAHYAKDKSTRLLADKRFPMGVRPYSVREWARLQGVPDWFEFPCSDTEAYRQIGNGVAIPKGVWIAREAKRYFGRNTMRVAA